MTQKNTNNAQSKADIYFGNDLWNAANELRGALAENQYKNHVLCLLFFKHLSKIYGIRKNEMQPSYNIDVKEQSNVLYDEPEY